MLLSAESASSVFVLFMFLLCYTAFMAMRRPNPFKKLLVEVPKKILERLTAFLTVGIKNTKKYWKRPARNVCLSCRK